MSVYSGFGTRQQETFYYKLLDKCVQLMATRIFAFYKNDITFDDRDWVKKMRKIFKFMNQMDQTKHMQPRFSGGFVHLIGYLRDIFGPTSALSKSPSSLIGGMNGQKSSNKTLQIIEEENLSEQVLQSLQYRPQKESSVNVKQQLNFTEVQQNINKDPQQQTFFPKNQENQINHLSSQREILINKSPIVKQDESFSKKLYKKISETKFLENPQSIDPNNEMANYINNGVKRISYMGILGKYGKKKESNHNNEYYPSVNISRNNNESSLQPSIRTTARIANATSILDLVSGVQTNKYESDQDNFSNVNAYNGTRNHAYYKPDRRFTLNGTKTVHNIAQPRYVEQVSTKISPTNYINKNIIQPQEKKLIQRENSLTNKSTFNQNLFEGNQINASNQNDYLMTQKLPNKRKLRQPDETPLPHQSTLYSHSAQRIHKNHLNDESHMSILDSSSQQYTGNITFDKSRTQELFQNPQKSKLTNQPPVIQLHTKHYHYNTNNIKIQMISDINQMSDEGESFRDASLKINAKHNAKSIESIIQQQKSGINRQNNIINDNKYQFTNPNPKKILLMNQNQIESNVINNSKLETPKRQAKKYFQLY